MNSGAVIAALLDRHSVEKGEWAVFRELSDSTGSLRRRSIDLFAINCWPSGGFRTIAYEVKVSKSDFMHEINDPTKRKSAEQFAGECYFATPANLVKPDEIPENWGLVEVSGRGCVCKKVAAQRKIEILPIHFVASLARRVSDPKPPWPQGLWKYEGKELDQDQLLEAAKISKESVYRKAEAESYRKAEKDLSKRYLRAVESESHLIRHFGQDYKPDDIQKLISGSSQLSKNDLNSLLYAHQNIGSLLRKHGISC